MQKLMRKMGLSYSLYSLFFSLTRNPLFFEKASGGGEVLKSSQKSGWTVLKILK